MSAGCLNAAPESRFPSVAALLKEVERVERGGPDVSCPGCGHVNTGNTSDLLKRECQECGRVLPPDFFRACPACSTPVRLDLGLCPQCRFNVASHYRAKELSAEIGKARDEDPSRAINLIGIMLTEGIGNRDELLRLNQEMLSVQDQQAALRQTAEGFSNQGDIEQAVEAWNAVFQLVPRHAFAVTEVRRLRRLLDEEATAIVQIRRHMDCGRFSEAASDVTARLAITPGRGSILTLGEECRKRESGYRTAMGAADRSRQEKNLYTAQRCLREALRFAASSEGATRLHAEVSRRIEQNERLLTSARSALSSADFGAADRALNEVESSQADIAALAPERSALDKARKRYAACIAAADEAVAGLNLTAAETEIRNALAVCPNSASAKKQLSDVMGRENMVRSSLAAVENELQSADFPSVCARLRECRRVWPLCPELSSATSATQEREKKFTSAMSAASDASDRGDLALAESELETAIEACPRADAAHRLLATVRSRQASVPPLIDAAKKDCECAQFQSARARLEECRRLWSLCPDLSTAALATQAQENTFTSSMSVASDASGRGDLTLAEREIEKAIEACPHAEAAHGLLASVRNRQASVPPLIAAAGKDCEAAKFQSAEDRLAEATGIWSSFPNLTSARASVQKTRTAYETHTSAADAAIAAGNLSQAETELQSALRVCPRSSAAQRQLEHLRSAQARIPLLLSAAKSESKAARFQPAMDKLTEAEALVSGFPGISSTREAIEACQHRYEASMARVREAMQAHELDVAITAAEDALAQCPQSTEGKAAKNATTKAKEEFEEARRSGGMALQRALFAEAGTRFEEALRLWPNHAEIGRERDAAAETGRRYKAAMTNSADALQNERFDDALSECEKAAGLCPRSGEVGALRAKIVRAKSRDEAGRRQRAETVRALAKVALMALAAVGCIWLVARGIARIRANMQSTPTSVVETRVQIRHPTPSQRTLPRPTAETPSPPTPEVMPIRQVTLSNVIIPEDVVKAGEVARRFSAAAQSNGNAVVVSLADALAIEKALQTFATGMDSTVRKHWQNGFDRFRRRADGENPASFEAQRQESRREAFRQATAAFEQCAATFGIPLIRNRNGQWLGSTWAYCVTQPIYPDGYKASARGNGVLKFDLPSRQYTGNRGNWIKLMGSGRFNGNMSAFGGWVEMMVSGRSEADIYMGRRLDMRLDMLLIPAVQMDANSGSDGMHDFFSSRHGVILGRVRLRMTGNSPTVLFDVPCGADALGTQDLNWKGALNYDAIPVWPISL